LISNSQVLNQSLNRLLGKAAEMLHAGAYLHQYAKYDFGKTDISELFVRMEQVLYDYQHVT